MNSTGNYHDSFKRYEQLLRKANAKNKKSVFDALAAANIALVTVTFDGEGDSGQIEDIVAYAKKHEPCELPATPVAFLYVSWDKVTSCEKPLREAVESLCYDYLSLEHRGWENNDGAFGEFTFNVARRQIDLDFNGRFIDSTLHTHTF